MQKGPDTWQFAIPCLNLTASDRVFLSSLTWNLVKQVLYTLLITNPLLFPIHRNGESYLLAINGAFARSSHQNKLLSAFPAQPGNECNLSTVGALVKQLLKQLLCWLCSVGTPSLETPPLESTWELNSKFPKKTFHGMKDLEVGCICSHREIHRNNKKLEYLFSWERESLET